MVCVTRVWSEGKFNKGMQSNRYKQGVKHVLELVEGYHNGSQSAKE